MTSTSQQEFDLKSNWTLGMKVLYHKYRKHGKSEIKCYHKFYETVDPAMIYTVYITYLENTEHHFHHHKQVFAIFGPLVEAMECMKMTSGKHMGVASAGSSFALTH